MLPELSKLIKNNNIVEAVDLQNRSIEFCLFLSIPAAVSSLQGILGGRSRPILSQTYGSVSHRALMARHKMLLIFILKFL